MMTTVERLKLIEILEGRLKNFEAKLIQEKIERIVKRNPKLFEGEKKDLKDETNV